MVVKFVDLFSGIGGFHAVASILDWQVAYACDIDTRARNIYEANWNFKPAEDITQDATKNVMKVPKHDVLFAGFPCQPFSKSGKQNGMDEARGTLFWNIARILEERKPKMILLENVPNLAGPRHRHEWEVIIRTLRSLNYRVSEQPFIISPHRLNRDSGGRPQNRPRIYIGATYVPSHMQKRFSLYAESLDVSSLKPDNITSYWNLVSDIQIDRKIKKSQQVKLTLNDQELYWLETWQELLDKFPIVEGESRLPGFPIWADVWLGNIKLKKTDPVWKRDFVLKNLDFYERNKRRIDSWLNRNRDLENFPTSRRKFEWQAGDQISIFDCLIQLRPSGIRVKRPNYAPSVVAITQTSIVGKLLRRLSPQEVAQLQGLPSWFSFGEQSDSISYRQLGNGISVGAAYQTLRALVIRDEQILKTTCPEIFDSVSNSPQNPDLRLSQLG